MVNRVRIEAVGESEQAVSSKLLAAWSAIKEHTGGEWEIEKEETQTTKTGWWGCLTVRRRESHGH